MHMPTRNQSKQPASSANKRAPLKLKSSRYFHNFHVYPHHPPSMQYILHRPTRSLSKQPASSSKKKSKVEAVVRRTNFKPTVRVLDKGVESEVV